jgi:Tol biopolymer transport system component
VTDDRITEAHWLPDGRLLAVDRDFRLVAMDANGGNRTVLFQENPVIGGFSVCPDTGHVLFSSADKTTGNLNIWRVDIQSSNATLLTNGKTDLAPACSSDSTYFVYSSLQGSGALLMSMPLAGGSAKRLSEKVLAMPTISPDGRRIAALATEGSGINAVKLIEILPSNGGTPLKTFSPAPSIGYGLQFSADGQAIYYVTRNKGASNIMMQPLAGGLPVAVTKFHDQFITSFDFDWTNKRLAVVRGTNRSDIVLITQQEAH